MTLLRIGDLARSGGVSVRMLRHYHELGLLVPDHIDPSTGYRSYDHGQLVVLRHLVDLKDVGLTLAEVGEILNERPTASEVRSILLKRRVALVGEIATAQANVEHIDRKLANLQPEEPMRTATNEPISIEVELKSVPPRLVAQLTAVAESWAPEDIGPVIQPLYPELIARMKRAGVTAVGPSTAWYEDTDEGRILVHATITIADQPEADPRSLGFEVAELEALDLVASTIHRGTMDDCDTTGQSLLGWIAEHKYRPIGYSREVDIECGPGRQWVTELQFAVEVAAPLSGSDGAASRRSDL